MSADPRLVSTRTTWYRGASTVTVFFSYLPLTASPAPEARAPEARAPDACAPRSCPARRATWPCRPPENGRPTRHPAARQHHTPHHTRSGLWSLNYYLRIIIIISLACPRAPPPLINKLNHAFLLCARYETHEGGSGKGARRGLTCQPRHTPPFARFTRHSFVG